MAVVSGRQQAELGKTGGSSESVHSIRRAFQMYTGASEGDALRRLMRRVHSTSTWVHLSPRCRSAGPPISREVEFRGRWRWFGVCQVCKEEAEKQTGGCSDEGLTK